MSRRKRLSDEERITAVQEYLKEKEVIRRIHLLLQYKTILEQAQKHDTNGIS